MARARDHRRQRRYDAAKQVGLTALPCRIARYDDDTGAIEASLIENSLRINPDAITEFETFARLHREGRSIADIAALFGMPEMKVRQRMAIGTLAPPIRRMIREGALGEGDVKLLTTASADKQGAYIKLAKEG